MSVSADYINVIYRNDLRKSPRSAVMLFGWTRARPDFYSHLCASLWRS